MCKQEIVEQVTALLRQSAPQLPEEIWLKLGGQQHVSWQSLLNALQEMQSLGQIRYVYQAPAGWELV